jgi:mannose-6-phosphate isomerase-like protein (cupin superfamily)
MPKKKKRKQPGHYCWRCGRRRANEKFSGKGHAKHICKDCVAEQRAELKRKRQIAEARRVATNLYEDEAVDTLLQTKHVRIERMILTGESTPDWSDHDVGQWLILLRGSAAIDFYGAIGLRQMRMGDYVFVPAHQKHKIMVTSKTPSVWLVVFVREKRVATKCRVKKKRSIKRKRVVKRPAKPDSEQRVFGFGG